MTNAAHEAAHECQAKQAGAPRFGIATVHWAECTCGYVGPVVAKPATAERHVQKHLKEIAR